MFNQEGSHNANQCTDGVGSPFSTPTPSQPKYNILKSAQYFLFFVLGRRPEEAERRGEGGLGAAGPVPGAAGLQGQGRPSAPGPDHTAGGGARAHAAGRRHRRGCCILSSSQRGLRHLINLPSWRGKGGVGGRLACLGLKFVNYSRNSPAKNCQH